jgi:hypothetical protein
VDGNLLNHPHLSAAKAIDDSKYMRCWIIEAFGR